MSKFTTHFLAAFLLLLNFVSAQSTDITYTQSVQYELTNSGAITRKQAAIWIPIIILLITVASVVALFQIDDKKNRDTILYTKFLVNLKDR